MIFSAGLAAATFAATLAQAAIVLPGRQLAANPQAPHQQAKRHRAPLPREIPNLLPGELAEDSSGSHPTKPQRDAAPATDRELPGADVARPATQAGGQTADREGDILPDGADANAPLAPTPQADSRVQAVSQAPTPAAEPNVVAAGGFPLWHDKAPVPGTAHTAMAELQLVAGGTIVASKPSYSIYQAGFAARAAYFVRQQVFVALDLELGGGAGNAPGVNRLGMNLGGAVGARFAVLKNLDLLPSIGLGYNLWVVHGAAGTKWSKNALQLDLRASVATSITDRFSLVVTPYIQPNLVHGGSGPREGPHVSLGLAAGLLAWL